MLSLFVLASLVQATLHSSIPDDLHAFPKYRVAFLHALPVSNHTAEHWLRHGLSGGQAEFLDRWHPASTNPLASPDSVSDLSHREPEADHHLDETPPVLEHIRLGPSRSYLCLVPPPPTPPPPPADDAHALTPGHSWSLLQPLSGTCLYHRHGWFTYSYCHNLHVRQFKELPVTYPHPPGGPVVEEDPEWESYTLGRSSSARSVDGELTVNDDAALASNLELARQGAGQRYLVQRWTAGTVCDKTGRPREIEVQFHCSMTTADTILFVKETRTCEYVLVVHTPRLCGEPGFKSRLEQMPETALRCREVVDRVGPVDPALPEGRHPFERAPRQPSPAPSPPTAPPPPPAEERRDAAAGRAHVTAKLLRQALEALLAREEAPEGLQFIGLQPGEEEDEYYVDIESLRDLIEEDAPERVARGSGKSLEDALRGAGYDVKRKRASQEDEPQEEKKTPETREARDEL